MTFIVTFIDFNPDRFPWRIVMASANPLEAIVESFPISHQVERWLNTAHLGRFELILPHSLNNIIEGVRVERNNATNWSVRGDIPGTGSCASNLCSSIWSVDHEKYFAAFGRSSTGNTPKHYSAMMSHVTVQNFSVFADLLNWGFIKIAVSYTGRL